jgi:hypothetical protein
MPPQCKVCCNPEQAEIDRQLLAGTSLRTIAQQHGTSATALHRHKKHISKVLVVAREAAEIVKADTLLDQVRNLLSQAQRLTQRAEEAGSLDTALRGIAQVRGVLELLGEISGQLAGKGTQVNVGIALGGSQVVDLKTMSNSELQQFLTRNGHPPLLEGQSHTEGDTQ